MTIRLIETDNHLFLYVDEVTNLEHETIIIEPTDDDVLSHSQSKDSLHKFFVEHAQIKIDQLKTQLKNKPAKFRYRRPMAI